MILKQEMELGLFFFFLVFFCFLFFFFFGGGVFFLGVGGWGERRGEEVRGGKGEWFVFAGVFGGLEGGESGG